MTRFALGINNCFAVKRWPEPERWAAIVRERLGLDLVQHCLDLADVSGSRAQRIEDANRVRRACADAGVSLHSTFTGLGVYATNMLLDPHPSRRRSAEAWYRRAIDFSAAAGAPGMGGHWGAFSATDWNQPQRRHELMLDLRAALRRISRTAHRAGLRSLFVENLPLVREPSTMDLVRSFVTPPDSVHAAVSLCLDVGHMCVPEANGVESDPYVWLRELGSLAPMIHLQQSEAGNDRHWPFTQETNRVGRIVATRVLDALASSGGSHFALILEVVPPFLKSDDVVLDELVASVTYWKEAVNLIDANPRGPGLRRSAREHDDRDH